MHLLKLVERAVKGLHGLQKFRHTVEDEPTEVEE
jgi:hypothetical protein